MMYKNKPRRNGAIGLGSAPATGAMGCALAAHTGRVGMIHGLVRSRPSGSGARARRATAGAAVLPRISTTPFRPVHGKVGQQTTLFLTGLSRPSKGPR